MIDLERDINEPRESGDPTESYFLTDEEEAVQFRAEILTLNSR